MRKKLYMDKLIKETNEHNAKLDAEKGPAEGQQQQQKEEPPQEETQTQQPEETAKAKDTAKDEL